MIEKAILRPAVHIGTSMAMVTLISCKAVAGQQMRFGGGKIHIRIISQINPGIAILSKTRVKSSIMTRYSATSTAMVVRN